MRELRQFHREGAPQGVPAGNALRDLQTARGAPLIDSTDESAAEPVTDVPAERARPDRRSVRWLAFVATAVIAVDLATKLWIVEVLGETEEISLLGGHLLLEQTRNAGAAFGFAAGSTVIFSVVAVVVIAVILRTSRKLRSTPWAVVLGLLLGGAAGNLVDRIARSPKPFQGHVVDWINFGPDKFAVFNAADSSIVVGGAIAVLLAMRGIEFDGMRVEGEGGGEAVAAEPVVIETDSESRPTHG